MMGATGRPPPPPFFPHHPSSTLVPRLACLDDIEGSYKFDLGRRRVVCRLIPTCRKLVLSEKDWYLRYEGYQDSVDIPCTSKEFVFLFDYPDEDGARGLRPADLVALRERIVDTVRFFLYDTRYSKLHQSLTLTYPLVVALPTLHPEPREWTAAVVGAALYWNGLGRSEALRQCYYLEAITGLSFADLGMTGDRIGRGLEDVRGRLRLDFRGHRRYVYRVHPVAGAMPLQATNWKCIHEGTSTKLDLPLACKGFVFVMRNGASEFGAAEQLVLQNILIAAVVSFVNGHVNTQIAVSTAYPLLVPLDRPRAESSLAVINAVAAAYEAFWSAAIDPSLFCSPGMTTSPEPSHLRTTGRGDSNPSHGLPYPTNISTATEVASRDPAMVETLRKVGLLDVASLDGWAKDNSNTDTDIERLRGASILDRSRPPWSFGDFGVSSKPERPIQDHHHSDSLHGRDREEEFAAHRSSKRSRLSLDEKLEMVSGSHKRHREDNSSLARGRDLLEELVERAPCQDLCRQGPPSLPVVQSPAKRKTSAPPDMSMSAVNKAFLCLRERFFKLRDDSDNSFRFINHSPSATSISPSQSGTSIEKHSAPAAAESRPTEAPVQTPAAASPTEAPVQTPATTDDHPPPPPPSPPPPSPEPLPASVPKDDKSASLNRRSEVERRLKEKIRKLKKVHQQESTSWREREDALNERILNLEKNMAELTSPALSTQVENLKEELEYANQMFHDLSVFTNGIKTEVNEAKELLVKSGVRDFPEVIPVHTFCEATMNEIKEALQRGGKPTKCLGKIFDLVDEKVRDACFDPLKRNQGEVVGDDFGHPILVEIIKEYGRPLAELIVTKKREIERYCPSGHYPTPVLYADGRELRLAEVLARILDTLKDNCQKAKEYDRFVASGRRSSMYAFGPNRSFGLSGSRSRGDTTACEQQGQTQSSSSASPPQPKEDATSQAATPEAASGTSRRRGRPPGPGKRAGPGSVSTTQMTSESTKNDVTNLSGFNDEMKKNLEEWLIASRLLTEHTAKTYVSCLHKLVIKVASSKRSRIKVLLKTKEDLKAFVTTEWSSFTKESRQGSDRLQAAWNHLLDFVGNLDPSLTRPTLEKEDDNSEPERTGGQTTSEEATKVDDDSMQVESSDEQISCLGTTLRRDFLKYLEKDNDMELEVAETHCKSVEQILGSLKGQGKGKTLHGVKDANCFVAQHSKVIESKVLGKNRKYLAGWHHFTGYLALESTGKSVSVNTGGPGVDETGSPTSVIKVLGGDLQRGLDVYMRHLKDDDTLHSSLMAPSSSPRMWEAFRTCLDQEGASGSLMTIKEAQMAVQRHKEQVEKMLQPFPASLNAWHHLLDYVNHSQIESFLKESTPNRSSDDDDDEKDVDASIGHTDHAEGEEGVGSIYVDGSLDEDTENDDDDNIAEKEDPATDQLRVKVPGSDRNPPGMSKRLKHEFEKWLGNEGHVIGNTAKTYSSSVNKAIADARRSRECHDTSPINTREELAHFINKERIALDRILTRAHKSLLAGWKHMTGFTNVNQDGGSDIGMTLVEDHTETFDQEREGSSSSVSAPNWGLSEEMKREFIAWMDNSKSLSSATSSIYGQAMSRLVGLVMEACIDIDKLPLLASHSHVIGFCEKHKDLFEAQVDKSHRGFSAAWKHFQEWLLLVTSTESARNKLIEPLLVRGRL